MKNKLKFFLIPMLSFLLLGCSSLESENTDKQEDNTSVPSNNNNGSDNNQNNNDNNNDNSQGNNNVTPDDNTPTETKLNPMDEPYIAQQYYLNHIGDIYSAWGTYRGKGTSIAVIDAGFNPYHEDFYYADGTSKVLELSASFTTNSSGVTSTSVGIDKVVNMGESHGTFCAGVAAAAINGKGVVGIAPEASLLLLKTDLKPKSIASAFKYAADHDVTVVTISIGSYYDYTGDLVNDGSDLGTVFDSAVKYCYDRDIPVISAGGNGELDNQPTEFTFPGCVDYVIGVGGLKNNSSTEIWYGSSYNSSPEWQSIDVFAPADNMFGCCHYDDKIYDFGWQGTSFASPIVAGLACLYFEKNPTAHASQFESDLYASCIALPGIDKVKANQLGHGRVDAGRLLKLTSPGTVTVTCRVYWDTCYAYVWNSVTGAKLANWPGTSITNQLPYTLSINTSLYDSVIFTKGNSGPQSPDLLVSSFTFGNGYDLNHNISYSSNNFLIGGYFKL